MRGLYTLRYLDIMRLVPPGCLEPGEVPQGEWEEGRGILRVWGRRYAATYRFEPSKRECAGGGGPCRTYLEDRPPPGCGRSYYVCEGCGGIWRPMGLG